MTSTLRWLLISILGAAALSAAPPVQDDDPVYIDEEKKDFLDKIERCRANQDWKLLFELQAQAALPKKMHKLVRLPGPAPRFVGLAEYLNQRFADLPVEALQHYRGQFDGPARREFELAKAASSREGLERVVDTWFYSSRTDEALDLLANLHVEEGRPSMAIHCWSRLLYHYPDSEIPRAVTAARLARTAAQSGQDSVLDLVRNHAKEKGIGGRVIVGDSTLELDDYLAGLKATAAAPPGFVAREPSIPDPGSPVAVRLTAVRPEVRRWSADLAGPPQPQAGVRPPVSTAPDFPFIPAYTEIDGHEMVVYTNGLRITVIDPSMATSERPEHGVYFSYPPASEGLQKPSAAQDMGRWGISLTWVRPFIGVTIDGDLAFATLYSGKRPREAPAGGGMGGIQDSLFGMTRLVCLNLRTQQMMWDTDHGEPGNQVRKLEFWERNFAFSGPPLVRGDRVYAGVGTSPFSEEESRVVCFDRRTGLPLWERFLASVANTRPIWDRQAATAYSRLTVLEEDRGVLIAHSNIGVLAALDAVTGHVKWLSKYPRTSIGPNQWGQAQTFARPASPIVILRGRIYLLPQDSDTLLIADQASGTFQKVSWPVQAVSSIGVRHWRDLQRIVGRMGEYIVLAAGGTDSCVLDPHKGVFYSLTSTDMGGCGRGLVDGETVYLPVKGGGLSILYGLKNWNPFDKSTSTWSMAEGGNVVRAGNYLLYASATKLTLLTDTEVVRAEYRRRLHQSPSSPAAWQEYGRLMRTNERWSEAARGYLNFIAAVEGDPEWTGRSREVRTELHGIFLKLGGEAAAKKLHIDAVAHYGSARDFAWDGPTMAEATRLLAGACEIAAENQLDDAEKRAWAKRAVEEYQELIRRAPPGFVRPGEAMIWMPVARFASLRISGLVKKYGPETYGGVARAAAEELRKAGKGAAALQSVIALYPDSPAAVEALDQLAGQAAAQGKWTAAAAAWIEMRARLGDRWTPAHQRRIHEAWEKAGDAERLLKELKWTEDLFKKEDRVGSEENAPTVAEHVAALRKTAESMARRPAEAPPGSTATLSTWEPATPASGSHQLVVGWDLVVPGGLDPVKWPADVELFARGSSIELWNVRTKKKIWTAPHPGGWTGIVFKDSGGDSRRVRVDDVIADSPASRAGLERGDFILAVDGASVTAEDFDIATEWRNPGTRLAISYARGDETRTADLVPVPWPASARPGIVGAAFTTGGALAVAWEDVVAAFDPEHGRLLWTSRPVRDRFQIRALHACSERILVHEHYSQERYRSAYRRSEGPIRVPGSEDQHSRVIGLADVGGAPLWAIGLKFELAMVAHHAVRFMGGPLDETAGVILTGTQGNVRTSELIPILTLEGREGTRVNLSPGPQVSSTWIVEPTSGTLWSIESTGRGSVKLKSFVAPDYARGPEIALDPYVDPAATGFSIAANRDRVAVVSVSRGTTSPRLAVFSREGTFVASTKPGQEPLKDRVMPPLQPQQAERRLVAGLLSMDAEGTVYLYNEAKSGARLGFMTALATADGSFRVDWDSNAPTLPGAVLSERDILTVASGPKGSFVTAFRAKAPGATEESTVLLFYDRKDGRLRKVVDDLAVSTDPFGFKRHPAPAHNGRVYLNRKAGMEIWGE